MDERVFHELRKLAKDRDWEQFHTPENLAQSIAIEAGELLELFQWGKTPDAERLREEVADVLTYCYFLAMRIDEDPSELILTKLEETVEKYPRDKFYGRHEKYNEL